MALRSPAVRNGRPIAISHLPVLSPSGGLSYSVWQKMPAVNRTAYAAHTLVCMHENAGISTHGNMFTWDHDAGGLKFWGYGVGSVTSPVGLIIDDDWHHYGVSWDGTTVHLVVDGHALPSLALSGAISTPTTPKLLVGDHGNEGVWYRYATCRDLAEVAQWNVALTVAEFAQLADRSCSPPDIRRSNLGCYAPLDDGPFDLLTGTAGTMLSPEFGMIDGTGPDFGGHDYDVLYAGAAAATTAQSGSGYNRFQRPFGNPFHRPF